MWHEMTGLPLVFGVWAADEGADLERLRNLTLEAARRGSANIDKIVTAEAADHGWPADLAARCLSKNLRFAMGDEERDAIEEFFHLCRDCGLLDEIRPLRFYPA